MLNTIAQKIFDRTVSTSKQAQAKRRYLMAIASHAGKLPKLSGIDQEIAAGLIKDSVYVTTLKACNIPGTSEMMQTAAVHLRAMKALMPPDTQSSNSKTSAFPHIFTVTDLPELFEWANQPRLLATIEHYVGLPVTFQGVHLRRDFANTSPVTTEFWHRDMEDYRMVKIFVYLTDATDAYGPLEYIPKSHVSEAMHRRLQKAIRRSGKMGLTDEQMATFVPRSAWRCCAVPAGSVVFADPVAVYHHGKSRSQERDALFFVYTSTTMCQPEHIAQYSDQTFARPVQLPLGSS